MPKILHEGYNPQPSEETYRTQLRKEQGKKPSSPPSSNEGDPMKTLYGLRSPLGCACVAALTISSSVVRAQETPFAWAARLENTYANIREFLTRHRLLDASKPPSTAPARPQG